MESAIAERLKCPRTRHRRVEDDYAPPYPAWVARGSDALGQVVMGYFGVQSRGADLSGRASEAFNAIVADFEGAAAPGHFDLAHFVDAAGYDTLIAIAYWSDIAMFEEWVGDPKIANWWNSPDRLTDGIGFFRELAFPRIERFETLFSAPDRLEGVGVVMGAPSGDDIQEHGYWGSMRDRLPLSQTDAMISSGSLAADPPGPSPGRRIRVSGHENIALIRSGQEWTETTDRERAFYLQDMEPVFREGMNFLRDEGLQIGCYFNRYMRHIDAAGEPLEKTFGLSYWRSLSCMERWAEAHPTHVAIFGTFMRIVQELESPPALRLYHEVSVLAPDEQKYEYINCHSGTGMLRATSVG